MTGTTVRIGPTSRKETALWLLETVVPGSAPNNLSVAFTVDGRLDASLLRKALLALVRRHETLRTGFVASGSELGRTLLDPDDCDVEIEAARLASTDDLADDLAGDLTAFVARPFALDGRVLVRAGLFDIGDRHVVCLALHHLVFDTLSQAPLLRELAAAYDALASTGTLPEHLTRPVPALPQPMPAADSLAYWRATLEGFDPASLALCCGEPDVTKPSLLGERVLRPLSPGAVAAVRSMQKRLRAPEAVVLLAAYYLLLTGHGAGPDVIVGMPVDVRPPGTSEAIGYHVNVVPLRLSVGPALSFRQLVRATREVFFGALTNADVPVDELSAELPRTGYTWRNLLFRHLFNYVRGTGEQEFAIGGLRARTLIVENGFSKFDLELFVLSGSDGITVRAVYGTEYFTRGDVTALLDRYEAALLALAADDEQPVGEVVLWSDLDRKVIEAANATAGAQAPPSVLDAVQANAAARPDAVAVADEDRVVSYHQLWNAAVDGCRRLAEHGVGAGDVVPVVARRGPELAAAVLASWLTGAAYLPIDPEHPAQRIAFQLSDSGARVAFTDGSAPLDGVTALQLSPVEQAPEVEIAAHPVDGARPAYLIYTSGSTGTPKGTIVAHRSLSNVVSHFARELSTGPQDATAWLTTFAFDISALELFVALASGGRVVIAPDDARLSGRLLADLVARHHVTVVQATPTTWRMVLDEAGPLLAGRKVLCGGEPASPALAQRLLATGADVHHVYGPTETAIWSTSGPFRAVPGARPDIGRPIANTRVMVADQAGRALGVGVRGELCIAGDGVAIGYHNRPELTADRFREHPTFGRYYRTGDEARWRPDGTLELLGRADRQVKVRGHRLELGEIEAVILRHPRVKAVAVVLTGADDPTIVAFVVATGADNSDTGSAADGDGLVDDLWQHSRRELPRAAVPQQFLMVGELPTNANEKVDYPALTGMAARHRTATGTATPVDEGDHLIATLVALWRELLERDDVTADTHFFANGGHSVLGALLVQRLEERTAVRVPLADLFAEPTPRRLADRMTAR